MEELRNKTTNVESNFLSVTQATISFIIFWDFSMFYQISFHDKWNDVRLLLRSMVYTHESHELPNNLRLRILGN